MMLNLFIVSEIDEFDIDDKLGENTYDIDGMVLKNVRISCIMLFQNNDVDEKGNYNYHSNKNK